MATDVCQFSAATGKCDCGPATEQCTDTFVPQCAGPCPSPKVCLPKLDASGECDCLLEPDVCEFDSQQATCGGPCPVGETCVQVAAAECDCRPPQFDCGDPLDPQCEGFCPAPQTCIRNPVGPCFCQ